MTVQPAGNVNKWTEPEVAVVFWRIICQLFSPLSLSNYNKSVCGFLYIMRCDLLCKIELRVRMCYGKPGKSWNFRISFSRPGKSWNLSVGHGKSWKLMLLKSKKMN